MTVMLTIVNAASNRSPGSLQVDAPNLHPLQVWFLQRSSVVQSLCAPVAVSMYAGVLEHALVKDATGELHVTAIQALLEVASDSPEQCAELYRGQLSWLRSFLTHTDATGKPPSNFVL